MRLSGVLKSSQRVVLPYAAEASARREASYLFPERDDLIILLAALCQRLPAASAMTGPVFGLPRCFRSLAGISPRFCSRPAFRRMTLSWPATVMARAYHRRCFR